MYHEEKDSSDSYGGLWWSTVNNSDRATCMDLDDQAHDSGNDNLSPTSITIPQIESDMQELVQLVLQNSSDGMHSNVTNSFLTVAKGFYYGAYCNPETINSH
ncbi:Ent-copalyl diphosphate synthase, chloroplastic isoform B [Glycine soja]|uniref:Ent-copalyl diphosphate synthase, chloroplastic isoform B n=1 Tax=Glycine soja TaxID=3848 RepID=A0A445FH44_GLYSO|nr:Ent-copalyl diphosphate synthase, chloroplastic isoform B [Glycine soja]